MLIIKPTRPDSPNIKIRHISLMKKMAIAILICAVILITYYNFIKFNLPDSKDISEAAISRLNQQQKIDYTTKISTDDARNIYNEMKGKMVSLNGNRIKMLPSEILSFYNGKGREILKVSIRMDTNSCFIVFPDSDYKIDKSFVDLLDSLESKYKK
ncbi:MAG TPA: hypothetical protein VF941_10025 [Clostridia bacterium]